MVFDGTWYLCTGSGEKGGINLQHGSYNVIVCWRSYWWSLWEGVRRCVCACVCSCVYLPSWGKSSVWYHTLLLVAQSKSTPGLLLLYASPRIILCRRRPRNSCSEALNLYQYQVCCSYVLQPYSDSLNPCGIMQSCRSVRAWILFNRGGC